jgi:undecaprenyl-diphosphatase
MVSAAMQIRGRWPERKKLCQAVGLSAGVIAGLTVVGRLLSGVHWFTDIVGGLLLSAALLALYRAAVMYLTE